MTDTQHTHSAPPPYALRNLILRSLGVLLLVAAGLKTYGMNVSPLPSVGSLSSPQWQTLVIGWELGLGFWLVSGAARWGAWVTALLTFAGFAVVSGTLGLQGVADCGCFGVIKASPWWAFGVDVVVLLLLLLFRPAWDGSEIRGFARPAIKLASGAAVLLSLSAGGSKVVFGSVSAGFAKLRGQKVSATGYVDFGPSVPGQYLEAAATITNYSDEPPRLIGGTSDCSCITTTDMPLTIPPGQTFPFVVKLRVAPNTTPGQLTRTAEIWTDCDRHRTLRIRLGTTVAAGD
jgi:hypothetical protein